MTDNELKKIREKISCPQFDDDHYGEWGILNIHQRRTIKRMLDCIIGQEEYINRQKAEIERMKANNAYLMLPQFERTTVVESAKAEAIKEFAERLKTIAAIHQGEMKEFVKYPYIDDLVKEMVGDV